MGKESNDLHNPKTFLHAAPIGAAVCHLMNIILAVKMGKEMKMGRGEKDGRGEDGRRGERGPDQEQMWRVSSPFASLHTLLFSQDASYKRTYTHNSRPIAAQPTSE